MSDAPSRLDRADSPDPAGIPHPTGRARRPEVLAPAGSPEALHAALLAGADAVYFGLQDGFNARARAANFSLADLPATVARIHRAGARAYVTLNTLVFEPELPHVERVIRGVAEAGVDALIVQDPAVCLLARAICPQLELHASTQMTVSSPEAVAFARDLGVTRVVVPRELSVAEIERFAGGSDVELEVFVHGALCVAWSGQCLTSEAWGGRSANRGQCAQSCRMPYSLVVDGERKNLGDVRYLLSPKDLAGARAVPELLRLGVHGLKIEGRQKGPQYVATAVAGYRRWVDALRGGGDRQAAERQLAQDLLAMSLSYTRGFGDGFFAGSDHQSLVEGRFPKHRGVYVGRVVEVRGDEVVVRGDDEAARASDDAATAAGLVRRRARVRDAGRPWTGALAADQPATGPQGELASPLSEVAAAAPLELRAGMGVVFDQGRPESDEPGGPVFAVARAGGLLRLRFGRPGPDLDRVRAGDRVFATSDGALAGATERQLGGGEPTGRVGVRLRVAGRAGEPLRAQLRAGPFAVEDASDAPLQTARTKGLDADLLREKLGAFGGTPFRLDGLDCDDLAAGLHLAPGDLKELRRRLVAALLPQVERGPVRTVDARPAGPRVRAEQRAAAEATAAATPSSSFAASAAAQLVPLVRTDEQLEAVIEAMPLGVGEVELDWMEFTGLGRAAERARAAGLRTAIATPRIGKPGEDAILDRILRLQPDAVLVRHWGALERCRAARAAGAPMLLHGDFSLNVTNSLTARHLLARGLDTVTASFDVDEKQLFALLAAVPAGRVAVVVHHRIPTFHTEHCVYAHLLGSGRDFRSCGRPCERHRAAVADHLGREHPVIVDVGCRNTIFHHEPQQAARWVDRLRGAGLRRHRVEFVREDGAATAAVLSAWADLLAGRIDADELARRTGASAQIGVAQGGMKLIAE